MPDFGYLGQIGASAFSGALGLAGSFINYKYQQKLAAQQNQYNIDMWKMQADYNSPQAQMQRFKDAGLNPNLIYGQGTNGNMSQAPQKVTPDSPEVSSHLQKLGELFNIEGLRTQIANRKKAQAEAKIAQVNAERNEMEFDADKSVGALYHFDQNTGRFIQNGYDDFYSVENLKASNFYQMKRLAENYNRNMLLLNRSNLLNAQYRYLQPQILMSEYEQRFQPWSFWIGNGTKVLNALPLPRINFKLPGNPNNRTFNSSFYPGKYNY